MIINMSVKGLGAVLKTDDEQGSLMMTVKGEVAVLLSTEAVSVIALTLAFDSVALLIVITPLKLSEFSLFVIKAKDGLKDQVGF